MEDLAQKVSKGVWRKEKLTDPTKKGKITEKKNVSKKGCKTSEKKQ